MNAQLAEKNILLTQSACARECRKQHSLIGNFFGNPIIAKIL